MVDPEARYERRDLVEARTLGICLTEDKYHGDGSRTPPGFQGTSTGTR